MWKWKCLSLSHFWLSETPWTNAGQGPLSVEFSRQECWSGLPFPSPQSSAIELWTLTDSCLYPFPLLELAIRKQVLRLKIWWGLVTFYSCLFFFPHIAFVLQKEWKVKIHIWGFRIVVAVKSSSAATLIKQSWETKRGCCSVLRS